jgi:hypothetical protein
MSCVLLRNSSLETLIYIMCKCKILSFLRHKLLWLDGVGGGWGRDRICMVVGFRISPYHH